MRDPYGILGVPRGATFEEIKSAYRRACKTRHPDVPGGSHEAMVELNTAYAFLLNELKSDRARSRQEAPRQDHAEQTAHAEERERKSWEQTYRDIDEELEEMRRAAEAREEALRGMRSRAWQSGDRATWAKLTWEDLARFFRSTARSGVKGLALLFAALVGVGSVLVEANFVSALILLGSGLGFAFSLALKSDKGGILSAGLLLLGIMTIWLPPVRAALFLYPVATISVLILLALIFKFAQAGGTVGLMTGGVLALYVIAVIVDSSSRQPTSVAILPMQPPRPPDVAPGRSPTPTIGFSTPLTLQVSPTPTPTPKSNSPEPRTLLASDGAILKFVVGIPYRLKVRSGRATSLRATQGTVKLLTGNEGGAECVDSLDFPIQSGAGPWLEIDRTFWACSGDAVMKVGLAR